MKTQYSNENTRALGAEAEFTSAKAIHRGTQCSSDENIVRGGGGGITPSQATNSQSAYTEKYAKGYGVRYPEGHIIRFYERIVKYKLSLTSGRLLDFGCGNGTHAEYFTSKGFEVYGVDIIESAIASARGVIGERAKLIEPNQSLKGLFGVEFNIIFANQSLYYLDNASLRRQVDELYAMSAQGGICFFTMMSRRNGYAKCITQEFDNGLSEVTLSGRLSEQSYINFIGDTQELQAVFAPFKPLCMGEYDMFSLYDGDEGSSHHYMFIGVKE